MSAVVAGVTCSGPGAHLQRHWIVDAERRLSWRDPSSMAAPSDALKRVLALPLPGTTPVMTCDAWNVRVLLANGAAYQFDLNPQQPRWLSVTKECDVDKKTTRLLYVAGGTGCGFVWVADDARRLWTWTAHGRREIGSAPVPGTARILAVDASRAQVILETGEMFFWTDAGWGRLPALGSTDDTVRVRGVGAFGMSTTAGELFPGAVLDLPLAEALRLIRQGRCEVAMP